MNNYPVQHPVSPLTRAQMRQLMADLNQARVATLKKGRTSLSYIEAWDARRSMIRIFGYGGFSTRVVNVRTVYQEQDVPAFEYNSDSKATKVQKVEKYMALQASPDGTQYRQVEIQKPVFNWRVAVETTVEVYIHQLGAIYSDAGVAGQVGPDIGEVADFATKTATSDTFKRCLINMGTQFGLSLYDNGSLGDVVGKVLAPGQRQIDIDWAVFEQAKIDLERSTTLEAERAKQAGPQGGAPAGREEQPVAGEAPSEEATTAATSTLAGGFGPQS